MVLNMAMETMIRSKYFLSYFLFFFLIIFFWRIGETGATGADVEYCSFFNNRAPQAQPGLRNCSWFKDYSCCQQQEIEATFGGVKPLKGASPRCQRFINYLMCYICAPNQNLFYQKERLTVCRRFCDSLYDACQAAILKGNRIVELYPSGREFCVSRRFLVGESNCFSFDVALDTRANAVRSADTSTLVVLLPVFVLLYYLVTALSRLRAVDSMGSRIQTRDESRISQQKIMSTNGLKDKWTVMLFVILLGTVESGSAEEVVEAVRSSDVHGWAGQLSRDLLRVSEEGFAFNAVQKIFREAPYDTVKLESAKELEKLKKTLETFFDKRKRLSNELSIKVAIKYNGLAALNGGEQIRGLNLTHKSVEDLPSSVFLDANRLYSYKLNESRLYNEFFRQKVIWGQSVVKLPDSTDRKSKAVIQAVEWTSQLDEIFKENRKKFPDIRWQYFGSNTGMFRLYPGLEWKKDFVGYPENFEPRMQPWYVDLKSGTRNIVIIIDISSSMKSDGLERAKIVANYLISSLNHNRNLAVIVSSSDAWDTSGRNVSGSVDILGCHRSGLFPATSQHREELVMAIQQLKAKGGSDHLPAFRKAFSLLRGRQFEDEGGKDCGSMIVFITDGKLDEHDLRCTPGYHKYSEDNRKSFVAGDICKNDPEFLIKMVSLLQASLPGSKANIFTFVTSVISRADLTFPGLLACDNNGVMSKILKDDTESSVFDQMAAYFRYIEATDLVEDPLLTGVYMSPVDGAAALTFSSAVINAVSKECVGVVAIDMALSDVEDLIKSIPLTGGDVFMMDLADGTAVVHPLAKRSYELEGFLPHVFVSELETDNGIPEEFSVVLNKMMSGETGDYKITNNASSSFLHQENLVRSPVKSVHYFFTPISGTNFGIAIKHYLDDDVTHKMKVSANAGTSYYHSIITSNNDEIKEQRSELHLSEGDSEFYKGVHHSSYHSTVGFGPELFCNLSVYHDRFGSSASLIQNALNNEGDVEKTCVIIPAARNDARLTLQMESHWKARNLSFLASTYVATPRGVMRVYPGVVIPDSELKTLHKESWYTRAVVNKGRLSVSPGHYGRHVPRTVVTFSRSVLNGTGCDSSFDSCEFLRVLGVVGMDVDGDEFKTFVAASLTSTNRMHKDCSSEHYPCFSDRTKTCQTQCYLVNNVGEIVYGLPRRQHASLSAVHAYVFKALSDRRIFLPKRIVGYQATCLDTGEVISPEEDSESSDRIFEMRHSCVEETLYYELNQTRLLDFGGVFANDLDDDPCHSGMFFVSAVNDTDLILLVFDDFQDFTRNSSNKACQKLKRESTPMTKRRERRSCTKSVSRYGVTNSSGSCDSRSVRAIVLPCGYSAAALAAFHSFVFLTVCSLLALVFLI